MSKEVIRSDRRESLESMLLRITGSKVRALPGAKQPLELIYEL